MPITLAVLWQGGAERPSPGALAKLGIAGVMMGSGLIAFNRVVNSRLDASISIPVVDTAMLIVTDARRDLLLPGGGDARKLVGLALLVSGIVALRPV